MIKLDDHGYACLGAVTIEGTFHLDEFVDEFSEN